MNEIPLKSLPRISNFNSQSLTRISSTGGRFLKPNLPIDLKIDNDGLWYKHKQQKNSHVMLDFIDTTLSSAGWRDFPLRNLPQNFNHGNIYTHFLLNQ